MTLRETVGAVCYVIAVYLTAYIAAIDVLIVIEWVTGYSVLHGNVPFLEPVTIIVFIAMMIAVTACDGWRINKVPESYIQALKPWVWVVWKMKRPEVR